jgi:hypothetical protein
LFLPRAFPTAAPVQLKHVPLFQRAISKSGPRFCVRSRANYQRAHDLIAKPPTLWRIVRLPFAGLLDDHDRSNLKGSLSIAMNPA